MADKMKKPDVRLEINGVKYGGWTKISIRRGIGQVAGTFELSITERWPGQPIPAKIELGASCVVTVDGAPVITGYVDDVAPSYNAASHTVSVTGRDKTCDLVDCCPPSTQLKGATLAAVARSLAAPFGIEVVDETGVGVVPGFKTNPGDTVFETPEQLARAKGVLLTTDGRGRLVICRASKKKAATVLELGKNVFEGKGKFSMRDRFSSVTVIGQTAATETWNGKSASQQKTVVTDAAVPRHRPLVLVADQEHQGANKRAQWEVNVRYGKGNQATYTVYGWKDGDALWMPNVLARIVDPFMGLEATWLVGSVGWTLDERGYRSELTLNPPEAFDVEPVSPKKGKKDKETFRWPGADTKES